ncbi:MAG: hypothetical protein COV36_03680 [Alphaproteobacteria bacterium CG11_big_fil_rev_8_21_14_0_20_44_7]|nr:MAG: hypothetical protein COV36_03680 [Alphaproteobacteria bacterium CG11_big_fil_rev_8_21_14_0_20_44_7]
MAIIKPSQKTGFSLLELAIALVVLGGIIFSYLLFFDAKNSQTRMIATQTKLEKIEKALRLYYRTNGDLPCPADGSVAESDAAFGTADCAGSGTGFVNITADYDSDASNETIRIGALPTRDLLLPDDYAIDGWNSRFTYAIDSDFTNGSWGGGGGTQYGSIKIVDNSGNTISDPTTAGLGGAVFVVISYGENKVGAWLRQGGTTRIKKTGSTSVHEDSNAEVQTNGTHDTWDNIFNDDFINDGEVAASYFDDIILWNSREMIDYDPALYD